MLQPDLVSRRRRNPVIVQERPVERSRSSRALNGGRAITRPELRVNVADVRIDRVDGDVELPRDVGPRQVRRQISQHAQLAGTELHELRSALSVRARRRCTCASSSSAASVIAKEESGGPARVDVLTWEPHDAHVQLVRHRRHAVDALGGMLGISLFPECGDGASSVTVPSFAVTAMARWSIFGSHSSSSFTKRRRSSLVISRSFPRVRVQ